MDDDEGLGPITSAESEDSMPDNYIAPCPFCGHRAMISEHGDTKIRNKPHYFYGNCITCDCEGPPEPTEKRARQSWNYRAAPSAQEAKP